MWASTSMLTAGRWTDLGRSLRTSVAPKSFVNTRWRKRVGPSVWWSVTRRDCSDSNWPDGSRNNEVECLVMSPVKLDEGNKRVETDKLNARDIGSRLDRYLAGN